MSKLTGGGNIFKTIAIVLLLSVLAAGGFIAWVILEAPLQKMDRIKPLPTALLQSSGHLERGALVDTHQLKTFLKLTKGSTPAWIGRNLDEKNLEALEGGRKLLVKKTLGLPPVWKNDCSRVYCLQHRLPFNEIPSVFWRGLIGIEDSRFLDHAGVDFKSITRALIVDITKMRAAQGGSTITQQLVKNLFYSAEKKILRKIKEMILGVYLESRYEKENILEAYLNEFEWGNLQGLKIKGLYAASLSYFGKVPGQITPFEAAILIGLLKGPYYHSPFRHLGRLKDRSHLVFKKLVDLNFISSQARSWNIHDWESWHKKLVKRHREKHFMAFWRAGKNGQPGLQFYEKYVFIERALNVLKEAYEKAGNKNLSIKALLGNLEGGNSFSFYSRYERKKKTAIEKEYHQVGSTLKPILYSYFFSQGKSSKDLTSTLPFTLDLKSGPWSPREARRDLPEEVTLEEALLKSYNRPVILLSREIGFEKVEHHLKSQIPRLKTPLAEYPAQLLGAVELSLKELFELYKNFFLKECRASYSPESVVGLMSDPSQTTIHRLVGRLGKLNFFGKTGTSNNGHDNWFVSFDGNEISVIWVGFEGKRQGKSFNLYGSNTAFRVFKRFSEVRGRRFNDLDCRPPG